MIEIQLLHRQALIEWVRTDAFKALPDLPISIHRAESQGQNPRAKPDDPALWLAWLDGELVGYLGILPDYYFPDGRTAVPCGWLSCLWVSDRHRGKSIAKLLVSEGVKAFEGQVLLTEFTPQAGQLYQRLGFFEELAGLAGIRLYYRLNLCRLLPPKHVFFEKIKPLLRVADRLGNGLLAPYGQWRRWRLKKPVFDTLPPQHPEVAEFIERQQGASLFRRGAAEWAWALEHPWLLQGEPDALHRRYYFSAYDRTVVFLPLVLRDASGAISAYLIVGLRNGVLKLPCCYATDSALPQVIQLIEWCAQQWQADTFTTFHPEIAAYLRRYRTFALFKKRINRHYLAAKPMSERLKGRRFHLQDGDGDCFFT